MSVGQIATVTPLMPRQRLSEEDLQDTVYTITSLREGNTNKAPVVVRQIEGDEGIVVRTTPLVRHVVNSSNASIIRRGIAEASRLIAQIKRQRALEERKPVPTILAIVPAHNEEEDIEKTIESLLLQTRPIDLIVIMVNNSTDRTAEIARRYEQLFPQLIVEEVHELQHGKVGALNYAWSKYASRGQYTFVLGVDADVECDGEMVEHLEKELIHLTKAPGVRARYSFKIPDGASRHEKRLIMNQRQEFAMTTIKELLRGGRTDILGGQATLFRSDALVKAARETDGGCPWNIISAVEDAELTRTWDAMGYRPAVSFKARAWVGPMATAYAWDKQRKKWQVGHLTDMIREFHPWQDRRRWLSQAEMGWNLLIRVMFFALLATSLSQDKYEFNPLWLAPIGLSVFQAFLVAMKLPNRRAGEILRALIFFPGELYLWKSLSVWVASVLKVSFDIRNNLWDRQYSAEAASKTHSASAWLTIMVSMLLPVVALNLLASVITSGQMDTVLTVGWWALSGMTIFSVGWMIVWIFRILRKYRTLAP